MPSGYNQHNLIFAHSVVLNYCCQRQEYQAFPLWALYEEILQNYSRTSSKKFQTYIAQIWNNVIQHMPTTKIPKFKFYQNMGKLLIVYIFLGPVDPRGKRTVGDIRISRPLFDFPPRPLLTRDSMRSYLISPTWAFSNILNDHNLSQYGLYSRT